MIIQPWTSVSVSTPFPAAIFTWDGGNGLIIVQGTFSGSAQLVTQWEDAEGFSVSGNVLSPITTAGVYPFFAPKGKIQCSLSQSGSVSGVTVTVSDQHG